MFSPIYWFQIYLLCIRDDIFDLSASGIITNQANVTADSIDPNSNNDMTSSQTTIIPECVAPISGDWIILSSCNIRTNITAPANVTIQNSALVKINPSKTLTITSGNNIVIKSGSGLLIKDGGTLQVNS